MHFDWGASQFLSKQLLVGLVGYAYQEIGCDSGSGDRVGCFRSRVFGVGPQLGYIFPLGDKQGYLNIKGYKEFGAENRPEGWNVWLTFVDFAGALSRRRRRGDRSSRNNCPKVPGVRRRPLKHGLLDRVDQLTRRIGLAQESNAADLLRLRTGVLVIEGRYENHRQRGAGYLQPAAQFNSRHAAEMNVEEQAIDLRGRPVIEKLLGRRKGPGRETTCFQQVPGGAEHAQIVIDHCNDLLPPRHGHVSRPDRGELLHSAAIP